MMIQVTQVQFLVRISHSSAWAGRTYNCTQKGIVDDSVPAVVFCCVRSHLGPLRQLFITPQVMISEMCIHFVSVPPVPGVQVTVSNYSA